MSPEKENRPAGNGAVQKSNQLDAGSAPSVSHAADSPSPADVAQQLNRRRETTKRLPPLSSGERDPWAANSAGSFHGHRATLIDTGLSASVHLRCHSGLAQRVAHFLDRPRPSWSSAAGGFAFARSDRADVIAIAEWLGARVRLSDRRRRDEAGR